ncbi:hypothetical protein [Bacillus phage phiAGATE]|uniref:Uncharacterized protein n=1 Tax=Bacillus phage phiAGATE TaxID=1204533 RepID=L0L8H6_9CAUD|nr:hypothetical protein G380_gp074 [Bacillus phage phiAGATE]AGB62724.1 hypothetical protein [Bacillus phage phiAGATE]
MRTKEEIIAELAQAEKEIESSRDRIKALEGKLATTKSFDLSSRFPHLTAHSHGSVSGQLDMKNSITNKTEKSLQYAFVARRHNSTNLPPVMWLTVSDEEGSKEIRLTEKHLSFLNQLVIDANAALDNTSISLFSKPTLPVNRGGHDNV